MAAHFRIQKGSHGSPFLQADFEVWDASLGAWKRKFRSTRTTDPDKAAKIAEQYWLAAQAAAGQGNTAMTQDFATKVVGDIMQVSGLGRAAKVMTWLEWRDFWLARCQKQVAAQTLKAYKTNFKHITKYLTAQRMAEASIAMLTERHMQGLWDWLRSEVRLSYGSAGVVFAVLRASFKYAVEAGYMERNPASLIQKTGDKVAGKRDIFTVEEVGRILSVAPPEWQRLTLLGLCTGLRLMDCVRLTWENLEQKHGVLVISTIPGKTARTGKRVMIPVTGPLAENLAQVPKAARRGPLLPEILSISQVVISKRYSEMMTRAGVVGERMPGKHGKMTLSFHSFRHTLTSWMKAAGVDKEVRMRITGHSSEAVHDGYTHVQVEAMQTALAAGLRGME